MSSSITTYTGPRSAKERASQAWGLDTIVSPEEQARTRRMITAIRKLEVAEHKHRIVQEQPRDSHKWRKAYNAHLRKQLRDNCHMCKGTGEITVDDGHGCIEPDECPRCSWFEPYAGDYPVKGEPALDVPF